MSYAPGTVLPGPHAKGLGATARSDAWWAAPLGFFLLLAGFVVYSTWAAFQGAHYWVPGTNYISPFYSPELWGTSPHAWFGASPPFWPLAILQYSPALLILGIPAGFRLTCYDDRKVYYRAFWADPTACAVGEPRNDYWGENFLPLILWNAHRFVLYLAIIFTCILGYDALKSFIFTTKDGGHAIGIGIGTVILTLNTVLLMGYTLGCHSFRHLVGGRCDSFGAKGSTTHSLWSGVTWLNERHPFFAMISLCWVAASDVYVRVLSISGWHDHLILFRF